MNSPQDVSDVRSMPAGSATAIWRYVIDTLDPVVRDTLLSVDNHYYRLCLRGHYSKRCHPSYLSPEAHAQLSRPGAFDGLRIHTDDLQEVVDRMAPGNLTIAVIMDSMDWFVPEDVEAASKQVEALNRALKMKGRVMLRSAGIKPWYLTVFESSGFETQQVQLRMPGDCVDRVNMYASTWVCFKVKDIPSTRDIPVEKNSMEDLEL